MIFAHTNFLAVALTLLNISRLTTQAAIADDPAPAETTIIAVRSSPFTPSVPPLFPSSFVLYLTLPKSNPLTSSLPGNQNAPARRRRNGLVRLRSKISVRGARLMRADARVCLILRTDLVIQSIVRLLCPTLRRVWVGTQMLGRIFMLCVLRRLVFVRYLRFTWILRRVALR